MVLMGYEITYEYFLSALNDWIKKTGRGAQKILAIETKKTKGYISQLLNPEREKPIPFEIQHDIANACGYSYEEFLLQGKGIVMSKKDLESDGVTFNMQMFTKDDDTFEFKKPFSSPDSIDPAIEILKEVMEEENLDIDMAKAAPLIQIIRDMVKEEDHSENEAYTLLSKLEKLSIKEYHSFLGQLKGTVMELEQKQKDIKASGDN